MVTAIAIFVMNLRSTSPTRRSIRASGPDARCSQIRRQQAKPNAAAGDPGQGRLPQRPHDARRDKFALRRGDLSRGRRPLRALRPGAACARPRPSRTCAAATPPPFDLEQGWLMPARRRRPRPAAARPDRRRGAACSQPASTRTRRSRGTKTRNRLSSATNALAGISRGRMVRRFCGAARGRGGYRRGRPGR